MINTGEKITSVHIFKVMSSGNVFLSAPGFQDEFTFDDDIPIFDRRAITNQPRETPLPIATVGRYIQNDGPFNGVRLLFDLEEVTIEQTYDLQDIFTLLQSENRYFIKSEGNVLFVGIEESSPFQRFFCSSRRGLRFTLCDRSGEEAIVFKKRFAFTSCTIGCLLQKAKVYTNSNLIGSIEQQWTPCKTTIFVKDSDDNLIYMIIGPAEFLCPIFKESIFEVLDKNCDNVSRIGQVWDPSVMNFKLTIKFPPRSNTVHKALLLVSGILLDYMFFESGKSGGCRCLTCDR